MLIPGYAILYPPIKKPDPKDKNTHSDAKQSASKP